MAEPLVIQFAADTSRATSAMQSLAASITGNMASAGIALSGLAANSNATGNSLGALQQNLTRAATAIGSDVKNIASATANAAAAEKATLQGVVTSFTAAAASSQTAQASIKAGVSGTSTAIGTLLTQLPTLQTLALGFLAFEASSLAFHVLTAAATAASEALDRFAKVGTDASRLGVSTTFLQTYTAQARELKVEADDLVKSLENAKAAFTVRQGEGGTSARNQSGFEARLREQAASGNATGAQVNRFAGANGTEAQFRAALDIITEIQAKGRDVAVLDLAAKIFPPAIIDRIRAGSLSLDEFKRKMDDIKNPDLVLLKPEEILRAQELNRRLEDAKATLDNAAKEFNTELARAGFGLKADAIAWQELMANGARAAVNILKQARQISEQMAASEPAIYGRDYFRPEDAPKSGLQKDLGAPRGSIPSTGDLDRDNALNRLRTNLGNRTLQDQAAAASIAMGAGIRPDRTNTIRNDKPRTGGGGSAAETIDPITTFTNQLEKSAAALKAEADNFAKSNAEKSVAIQLAKAQEIASQNGTKLTDAQTSAITKAAQETSRYRDSLQDLEQQQRQNAEAARFFGSALSDGLADAILEGRSLSSIFDGLSKQLARSALQGIFTGQGPLAGLLGTAPAASAGGSAVGGIAGLLSTFFGGFKANGGPVDAGRAYTVGERGREMFIPNSNGQIVPIAPGNGGGGNTTQVSVHNYAGGQVEATAERRSDGNIDILVREIEGRMAQRGYRGQGPFRGVLNTPGNMRG